MVVLYEKSHLAQSGQELKMTWNHGFDFGGRQTNRDAWRTTVDTAKTWVTE